MNERLRHHILITMAAMSAMYFGISCVIRSSDAPSPEPTRAVGCFGTSDFSLSPVVGVLSAPRDVESVVGVRVPLPTSVPTYAERLSTGVVATSIGKGRPAFVIDFHSADIASPLGDIIYADRPLCELDPKPPAQTISVGGHSLFIWTENLKVKYGIRGVLQVDATYIDITLAWPSYTLPDKDARVRFLRDWAERIVG